MTSKTWRHNITGHPDLWIAYRYDQEAGVYYTIGGNVDGLIVEEQTVEDFIDVADELTRQLIDLEKYSANNGVNKVGNRYEEFMQGVVGGATKHTVTVLAIGAVIVSLGAAVVIYGLFFGE